MNAQRVPRNGRGKTTGSNQNLNNRFVPQRIYNIPGEKTVTKWLKKVIIKQIMGNDKVAGKYTT